MFAEVAVGGLLQLGEDVGEDGREVFICCVVVATDKLDDSFDDVLSMRVLLHQRHHVVSSALHYLVVALASLREGALGMRHQHLIVETGGGQIEEQFDETDILFLDGHQ